MSEYDGHLRLPHEGGRGVRVRIDLDDESMRVSSGDIQIGDWTLDDLVVAAKEDGFHVRAEGEEVVITTDDDPGFAVELGVRNAPPLLRRQISDRLREQRSPAD